MRKSLGKVSLGDLFLNRKTMKKLILFTVISLFYANTILAQPKNKAFQEGESLTYVISYNWGFIWIEVGEVNFKITAKTIHNKKYLKFIIES